MQSPSFFEKQTSIGRNSRMTNQEVIQSGNVSAISMATLHGLLKLLGVTQEDYARIYDGQCRPLKRHRDD
jgi:hypothetical protein